jgi:hypothetical protein
MTTNQDPETPLRKGYLILLGISLVVLAVSFGGNSRFLKILPSLLKRKTGSISENATGRTAPVREGATMYKDLSDFAEWFQTATGAVIVIERASDRDEDPVEEKQRDFVIWPVRIHGTVRDGDRWSALVGPYRLAVGDTIEPSEASGKCGYTVLHVSRHCVWFAALAGGKAEVPAVSGWPDIDRIQYSPGPQPTPTSVHLGENRYVYQGDSLVFKRTGSRMTVRELWARAVHFEYRARGRKEPVDFVCAIVW